MKGFLFFQRAGLFFNICFIAVMILRALPHTELPQWLTSFLLVAGWPIAFFVNLVLLVWFLILRITGNKSIQPKWLPLVNAAVFIVQILFFFA
jgi:hypothetical protein